LRRLDCHGGLLDCLSLVFLLVLCRFLRLLLVALAELLPQFPLDFDLPLDLIVSVDGLEVL
jgi:hypothetical protein